MTVIHMILSLIRLAKAPFKSVNQYLKIKEFISPLNWDPIPKIFFTHY